MSNRKVQPVEIIEPEPPPEIKDVITITMKWYKQLREDSRQYHHLLSIGVDNWEHYSVLGDEEEGEE